jgi:hypothetical protein
MIRFFLFNKPYHIYHLSSLKNMHKPLTLLTLKNTNVFLHDDISLKTYY